MSSHELRPTSYNLCRRWLRFGSTKMKRNVVPPPLKWHTCIDFYPQFDYFSSLRILYLNYREHLRMRQATNSSTYKWLSHKAFTKLQPQHLPSRQNVLCVPTLLIVFLYYIDCQNIPMSLQTLSFHIKLSDMTNHSREYTSTKPSNSTIGRSGKSG